MAPKTQWKISTSLNFLCLIGLSLALSQTSAASAIDDEPSQVQTLTIAAISDTHNHHEKVVFPDIPIDILIHAGDFTQFGDRTPDIVKFNAWLGKLTQIKHKVVVRGNHEHPASIRGDLHKLLTNAHYLEDEALTLEGLTIFGSGWDFKGGNGLFWPKGTQVLVTHQAPWKILGGFEESSLQLAKAVAALRPSLHIFGHHHDCYGIKQMHDPGGSITFVNAAVSAGKKIRAPHILRLEIENGKILRVIPLVEDDLSSDD